jgi:hypothetical protein
MEAFQDVRLGDVSAMCMSLNSNAYVEPRFFPAFASRLGGTHSPLPRVGVKKMTSRSSVAREPRFCHGQPDVRVPWVATAARKVTPLTSCHSPVALSLCCDVVCSPASSPACAGRNPECVDRHLKGDTCGLDIIQRRDVAGLPASHDGLIRHNLSPIYGAGWKAACRMAARSPGQWLLTVSKIKT